MQLYHIRIIPRVLTLNPVPMMPVFVWVTILRQIPISRPLKSSTIQLSSGSDVRGFYASVCECAKDADRRLLINFHPALLTHRVGQTKETNHA